MNNMGSSNSVVRMDMKTLIDEDIKLAAISYTFAATQTLSSEYIKGTVSNTDIYKHHGSVGRNESSWDDPRSSSSSGRYKFLTEPWLAWSSYEQVILPVIYKKLLDSFWRLKWNLIKVRKEDDGLYMLIQISDNQANFEKIIVIIICLSFLVLLIISLIWVLFYYFQRFRLLHRQYAVSIIKPAPRFLTVTFRPKRSKKKPWKRPLVKWKLKRWNPIQNW